MGRVVRVASAEQRLRDIGPRLLAAIGRRVVERMQHPVVAAHVDHRAARCLGGLERVVTRVRRAGHSRVRIGCAGSADRNRGRVDDVAENVGPGAETRGVDALVRFVAAQEIQHGLRRGLRRHDAPSADEGTLLRRRQVGEPERNRSQRRVVDRDDPALRIPAVHRTADRRLRVQLQRRRPQRRIERIAVDVDGEHAGGEVDRVLLDVAPDAGFVARLVGVLVGHAQLRSADPHRRPRAGLIGEVGQRADDALRQLLRVVGVEILAATVDRGVPEVVDGLGPAGAGGGRPVGGAGGDAVDAVRIRDRSLGADGQAIDVDVLPRRKRVLHLVGNARAYVADPVIHREVGQAVAGRRRSLVVGARKGQRLA